MFLFILWFSDLFLTFKNLLRGCINLQAKLLYFLRYINTIYFNSRIGLSTQILPIFNFKKIHISFCAIVQGIFYLVSFPNDTSLKCLQLLELPSFPLCGDKTQYKHTTHYEQLQAAFLTPTYIESWCQSKAMKSSQIAFPQKCLNIEYLRFYFLVTTGFQICINLFSPFQKCAFILYQ